MSLHYINVVPFLFPDVFDHERQVNFEDENDPENSDEEGGEDDGEEADGKRFQSVQHHD